MLAPAIISLLAGTALGQWFRVLILGPIILLTLLLALGVGIAHGEDAWAITKAAAAAIVGLQVGYLFGIGLRHLTVLARANRQRAGRLLRIKL